MQDLILELTANQEKFRTTMEDLEHEWRKQWASQGAAINEVKTKGRQANRELNGVVKRSLFDLDEDTKTYINDMLTTSNELLEDVNYSMEELNLLLMDVMDAMSETTVQSKKRSISNSYDGTVVTGRKNLKGESLAICGTVSHTRFDRINTIFLPNSFVQSHRVKGVIIWHLLLFLQLLSPAQLISDGYCCDCLWCASSLKVR